MVILTEQIEIPASYEKMEAWAANFEEEFVKWSPYHIECKPFFSLPKLAKGRPAARTTSVFRSSRR